MTIDQDSRDTGPSHPIAWFSGRANEVLDGLVESPAWAMTPEEQRDSLVGLSILQDRIAELRFRVLAAGDNNDIGKDEASSSTAAW